MSHMQELQNKAEQSVDKVVKEGRESRKHEEGPIARTIEQQTAKVPSDVYLMAAVGAMGLSLLLEVTHKKRAGNFIATWVPTILTLGLYNKLVKLHGSDPEGAY